MNTLRAFLPILLFLSVISCVKPFDIGVNQVSQQLVVDGLITNQPGSYSVKLTYSAAYTNGSLGTNLLVVGANVFITDNLGNRTPLPERQLGIYRSDSAALQGVVGRSYQLHIEMPDGGQYESKPELLKSVSPIDSIYWEYHNGTGAEEKGIHVYLDTTDPPTRGDYYRWKWTHYETAIYNCQPCWDIFRCYGCTTIASDVSVNGNRINRQPLLIAPFDSYDTYYLEVEQYSLTEEAYRFWKAAGEQSNGAGGPFDTPPAPVPGNIQNLTHPDAGALGFFGASALETIPYWIDRSNIPDIPPLKPAPPSGPGQCVPCEESVIKTSIKPRFWNR